MDHKNAADARTERYRHAEAALWKHYELEPTEQFLDIQSPRVRVRVQVIGSGIPILFIHGGVWPGAAFASLIGELSGFRCDPRSPRLRAELVPRLLGPRIHRRDRPASDWSA